MRVGSRSDLQLCIQQVVPYWFITVLSPPITLFHQCTGVPISITNTFPFFLCCVSQSLNSCFYGSQLWGTPGSLWEYTQPQPVLHPNSGALPVAAPPQSLVADGDIFLMAAAVLGHQFPHPDAPLAREEDHWQWLSSITGRYMYQQAVTMWMGNNKVLGTEQHEVQMPAPQSRENSVVAPKLPSPTLLVCPDTNLFHRADISVTSSCQ